MPKSNTNGSTPPTTQRIAAIYARVSTADQADKGFSLPTQTEACQTMALQEGYTVPESHIFQDDMTGAGLNRPQFTGLRELVRQRLIAAVFVYDLDRLSRKLAHQLLLAEEFEQAGVALRIVTMPDDAKTPETQLLSHVRGIIAEYERAKILERTKRGRLGRAKAGYVTGGRRTLGYAYVKHADKGAHYEIHPEEAALVQRIFRLYVKERISRDAIAARLTAEGVPTYADQRRTLPVTVWHPSSVGAILRNTAYIGTVYEGKTQNIPSASDPDKKTRHRHVPKEEWIAVPSPAIIDQETFDAAQALLVRNRKQAKRNRKHAYLFTNGRLRCGQCGCAMTGLTNRQGYAFYRCSRAAHLDVITPHSKRNVQATAVEPVVWSAVERVLNDPELIANAMDRRQEDTGTQQADLDRERQIYERQLAQCERDLKRWEALYLAEGLTVDEFKAKRAELDVRRASAERELARLDGQQRALEQVELETASLIEYCARVRSELTNFTVEEKRQALEALNITVIWHPVEGLEIHGSIPIPIVSSTSWCTGAGSRSGRVAPAAIAPAHCARRASTREKHAERCRP